MDSIDLKRKSLADALSAVFPHGRAVSLICDATFRYRGFEGQGLLDSIVEGRDGWGGDAGGISFPNELAEESGEDEAQYGYIEFEIDAGPPGDPYWIDQVPLSDAFAMFDVAAQHYVSANPDRRDIVMAKMRTGRKTFDRLIARHEAWKKANGRA